MGDFSWWFVRWFRSEEVESISGFLMFFSYCFANNYFCEGVWSPSTYQSYPRSDFLNWAVFSGIYRLVPTRLGTSTGRNLDSSPRESFEKAERFFSKLGLCNSLLRSGSSFLFVLSQLSPFG